MHQIKDEYQSSARMRHHDQFVINSYCSSWQCQPARIFF